MVPLSHTCHTCHTCHQCKSMNSFWHRPHFHPTWISCNLRRYIGLKRPRVTIHIVSAQAEGGIPGVSDFMFIYVYIVGFMYDLRMIDMIIGHAHYLTLSCITLTQMCSWELRSINFILFWESILSYSPLARLLWMCCYECADQSRNPKRRFQNGAAACPLPSGMVTSGIIPQVSGHVWF